MNALTLTAYAARRGCSVKSVSRAIATGRLVASVGRTDRGIPTIADPELADREWEERTRKRADYTAPEHPLSQRSPVRSPRLPDPPLLEEMPGAAATLPSPSEETAGGEIPPYHRSQAVKAYHAARKEAAAADLAELELAERRGEMVDAKQVYADFEAHIATARTKLLAVPSRLGQEAPELAARIVPVAERLIREALEELAVDGDPA